MEVNKINGELYLEKELLSPFRYFEGLKGKRRFLKIFLTFNHWLKVPAEKVVPLWEIINDLYVSVSIFDDVQDNTKVRGVWPSTHSIFGVPLTINASMHSLLLILDKAANLSPKVCKVIIEEYLDVFRGTGTEIYWRDSFICPTEAQFLKMSTKKVASFFLVFIRMLQLYSDDKKDYSKLVYIISTFIHVNDDYCNLVYQEGLEGWPKDGSKQGYDHVRFYEDITEGKFTLPLLRALQSEYRDQIMHIIRQRTTDLTLKKHCVSLIEKSGALQYSRDMMVNLEKQLRAEVAHLGGNDDLEKMLEEFLGWKKEITKPIVINKKI